MVCMLGEGAANNNYVLLTESVRTEADCQWRSPCDCRDVSQTDVRLPKTSYSTATRHHIRNGFQWMIYSLLLDWISVTHLALYRTGSSAFQGLDNLSKPESEN